MVPFSFADLSLCMHLIISRVSFFSLFLFLFVRRVIVGLFLTCMVVCIVCFLVGCSCIYDTS
ncbi:hypothetical protein BDZ91DRAFT_737702 [Kalaharituber pfeilii]|nr:hypothetical protein BDZ91DRAFT_737702 [Kalaharituber pfeilii]